MYKRGGHDKREQVPWTRLKRGTEWKWMRSSADDDDGILRDAEEGPRLKNKKDNGGVTFSDWARLKRQNWRRMKKERGVLNFTDWARLKRGAGEWTRLKKEGDGDHWTRLRRCSGCPVEDEGSIKLWTRVVRSGAQEDRSGDQEDEEKTKLWTRIKRGDGGWVRMM